MSSFERAQNIFNNRENEAFRAVHYDNYMFIREFEMVTLEDHI